MEQNTNKIQTGNTTHFGKGIASADLYNPNPPASPPTSPPPQQPPTPAPVPTPTKTPNAPAQPEQQGNSHIISPASPTTAAQAMQAAKSEVMPVEIEENEVTAALQRGEIERVKTIKITPNTYLRVYVKKGGK